MVEFLAVRPGATIVDATLGLGGHAAAILETLAGRAHIVGIDWDEEALTRARERLRSWGSAVDVICGNFADLSEILEKRGFQEVDGIVLDLGVSSLQLEDASRGFSFRLDGPLDMRMSQQLSNTAGSLLRGLGERELAVLLREYGEERRAKAIARAIVRLRSRSRPVREWEKRALGERGTLPGRGRIEALERTRALAELVARIVPSRGRIHPATRVFQALRIAVNNELGNLKKLLESFDTYVRVGGRIVVVSFHSLEDRLVKRAFREKAASRRLRILTRRPLRPTSREIAENPRARSARLRAAERIEAPRGGENTCRWRESF